ncbi:hypothetical protein PCC7418_3632 [Halothece sp. PCC 7418]|uniref:DUF1565 domain-containing protein n=1 Tax=Halothece sp. (strain PCC 7418) TaxID=65093 RepID=UPI0002A07079|nr:DUF1565 domain-containing protein [Halothece sp. PCC 7418]AFZ45742.1 hypothetical protein PCC7418_3632 [Halothece sp. PCC 7418]
MIKSNSKILLRLFIFPLIGVLPSACTFLFYTPPNEIQPQTSTPKEDIVTAGEETGTTQTSLPNTKDKEEATNTQHSPETSKSEVNESEKEDFGEETKDSGEVKADLFVSPSGSDQNKQINFATSVQLKEADSIIFVSPYGSNKNIGSQEEPFRSLTRAIKEAQKRQAENPEEEITIKLDKGTYSERSGENQSIEITSGIHIVGSGDSTILLADIKLFSDTFLKSFQVKDHNIKIGNSENNNQPDSTMLEELWINNGRVVIDSSNTRLTDIELSNYNSGSHSLIIFSGSPTLNQIKILNNSYERASSYRRYHGSLEISNDASPQIKEITIENSILGINNQGNTTIQNLKLIGNRAGILNQGEMTIKNLSLSNAKQSHFGICNYDQGTILIEMANFNKNSLVKSEKCSSRIDQSYPDSIPNVAGNYDDVVIENHE